MRQDVTIRLNSKGLVVAERTDLVAHKRPFAHEHAFIGDLLTAVETLKPARGDRRGRQAGKAFTQPIVEAMTRLESAPNRRPLQPHLQVGMHG